VEASEIEAAFESTIKDVYRTVLQQSALMTDTLRLTGDAFLVVVPQENPMDPFLGVGIDPNETELIKNPRKWKGNNTYGKVLMELRKELISPELEIPSFLNQGANVYDEENEEGKENTIIEEVGVADVKPPPVPATATATATATKAAPTKAAPIITTKAAPITAAAATTAAAPTTTAAATAAPRKKLAPIQRFPVAPVTGEGNSPGVDVQPAVAAPKKKPVAISRFPVAEPPK
jgi:hypothetical protein